MNEGKTILEHVVNHRLLYDKQALEIVLAASGDQVDREFRYSPWDHHDDPQFGDHAVGTAAHLVCRGKLDVSLLPILAKAGADFNKLDGFGKPPAYYAVTMESFVSMDNQRRNAIKIEALTVLFDPSCAKRANVNWMLTGSTPPARRSDVHWIRNGCNPPAKTLTQLAVEMRHHDVLKVLLKNEAPVDGLFFLEDSGDVLSPPDDPQAMYFVPPGQPDRKIPMVYHSPLLTAVKGSAVGEKNQIFKAMFNHFLIAVCKFIQNHCVHE